MGTVSPASKFLFRFTYIIYSSCLGTKFGDSRGARYKMMEFNFASLKFWFSNFEVI